MHNDVKAQKFILVHLQQRCSPEKEEWVAFRMWGKRVKRFLRGKNGGKYSPKFGTFDFNRRNRETETLTLLLIKPYTLAF